MSLLTDFGVESAAWLMPDLSAKNEGRQPQAAAAGPDEVDDVSGAGHVANPTVLFKYCMPLPDCDHSLHHASQFNTTPVVF